MITWDDCIKAADDAIVELPMLINTDAIHGVQHTQHMALALCYKQQAMLAKALGKDPQRYEKSIERAIQILRA